jgi:hypothetical protein
MKSRASQNLGHRRNLKFPICKLQPLPSAVRVTIDGARPRGV